MTVVQDIFYFIIALGILVTIHEYGHFWVARKLGVKVITFSVGFGKPIWQRLGKDGVNYQIAMIPLGGYVKMLDEREGHVSQEDLAYAFNRQLVWKRIAIVLAGPVANFILAIALYWGVFIAGITSLGTQMGEIDKLSIAGKAGLQAGDKITHVDGYPVNFINDVVLSSALRIGDKDQMVLTVETPNGLTKALSLDLSGWNIEGSERYILDTLGLRSGIDDQVIQPVLTIVQDNSAASKAGLLVGDRIVAVNQSQVKRSFTNKLIAPNPGKTVAFSILRGDELKEVSVVIGSREVSGKTYGFLGIGYELSPTERKEALTYIRTLKGDGIFDALGLAVKKTQRFVVVTGRLFAKLVTGKLSLKNISGPISIAEGAGGTARAGLIPFVLFIAMISINLGFINLLPIPMLDGGHLLYFIIESVRGKPLSEKTQALGLQLGMLMVFALMGIAIFNDIARLWL
jgi:regulator of sigma E protease